MAVCLTLGGLSALASRGCRPGGPTCFLGGRVATAPPTALLHFLVVSSCRPPHHTPTPRLVCGLSGTACPPPPLCRPFDVARGRGAGEGHSRPPRSPRIGGCGWSGVRALCADPFGREGAAGGGREGGPPDAAATDCTVWREGGRRARQPTVGLTQLACRSVVRGGVCGGQPARVTPLLAFLPPSRAIPGTPPPSPPSRQRRLRACVPPSRASPRIYGTGRGTGPPRCIGGRRGG